MSLQCDDESNCTYRAVLRYQRFVLGRQLRLVHARRNGATCSIENLYINNNQLSGLSPLAWGTYVAVTKLYLNNNQLSGTPDVCLFSNLPLAVFANNSFSGPLNMSCFALAPRDPGRSCEARRRVAT